MAGTLTERGQALDNLLVEREQLLIQKFTVSTFGADVPYRVRIPINLGFRFGRNQMPEAMRTGILFVEEHLGETFNFWDTFHRIVLGEAWMSEVRHGGP